MNLLKNTLFINLEHRKDRLEHIMCEFQKIGVTKAMRVNAIRTKLGAIGCTLSHIRCLEIAKQSDFEHVFICEDDITFLNPELFLKNLTDFDNNDQINWDMCLVGANNLPPYHKFNDYCIRVFYAQTTTGYIVKKHYYDTLIANFKEGVHKLINDPSTVKQTALDIYWKKLQCQDFWYMIIPATVTQYSNYSDIENCKTDYTDMMIDLDKKHICYNN